MTEYDNPNPLRNTLTPEQQVAIDTIAEPYLFKDTWPVYQYVEGTLDENHGIDASVVLGGLPMVGNYGLVWPQFRNSLPRPEERIGLTVAGLSHAAQATQFVTFFMNLLSYMIDRQRHIRLSPDAVQEDLATSEEVIGHLRNGFGSPLMIYEMMLHEPAMWRGSRSLAPDGSWTVSVERDLRHYRNVSGIEEYLDRIQLQESPMPRAALPVYTSPFGLPATIDYLDAVWRLAFRKGLFALPSATATLKLGLDCLTEDEFDSRLSALASVLSDMKVPDSSGSGGRVESLKRLGDFLVTDRGVQGVDRVERAVGTLQNIVRVRVGVQHPKTRGRSAAAYKSLGVVFPPSDWAGAWATIRSRAIESLDAIREEVDSLVAKA